MAFRIHYLVNRDEEFDIYNVSFPGINYVNVIHTNEVYDYSHHVLKTAYVEINSRDLEINQETVLNEMTVYLTNGDKITTDIGEVKITPLNNQVPFDFIASGSSSDDTGFEMLSALEPVELQKIEVPFNEQLGTSFNLYLNTDQDALKRLPPDAKESLLSDIVKETKGSVLSADSFPLSLKNGELFKLDYDYSFSEEDPNRFHYFDFFINLRGKTETGDSFVGKMRVDYIPYLDEGDINEIINRSEGE
ncbi:MAG TPA: hypothetical protein VNM69_00820 [Bacillus sp. (in: firmicutes)]|nr:hypothetical protein [Bacillus sp. (in: firmicutes)]